MELLPALRPPNLERGPARRLPRLRRRLSRGGAIERYDRYSVLILSFAALAPEGEPEPADDVAELGWFAADEIPAREEFASGWHPRLLGRWAGGSIRSPS